MAPKKKADDSTPGAGESKDDLTSAATPETSEAAGKAPKKAPKKAASTKAAAKTPAAKKSPAKKASVKKLAAEAAEGTEPETVAEATETVEPATPKKTASKKVASKKATSEVAAAAPKKAAAKKTKPKNETAEETPDAPAPVEEPVREVPAFPSTDYSVVEKLLVGFLSHEIRKVGLSRAVLGLSGGVDSAVSAALAARALGPNNVLGVMMPYQSSSPESLADAHAVAENLGIETMVVDISKQVDAYFGAFPEAAKLRRGNKMARERMTVLYDQSAVRAALVVGTSNKTELLLGYGTLYGDMASALNPIGDLYKTQVWGLARHLGLPASVIEKAPTADLWSGQTDEAELGFSYHEVDRLLYRMIDERCSRAELLELGFAAEFLERIARMIQSSQFKRRLPVIAKISARSIDTDFRYSRDWGL